MQTPSVYPARKVIKFLRDKKGRVLQRTLYKKRTCTKKRVIYHDESSSLVQSLSICRYRRHLTLHHWKWCRYIYVYIVSTRNFAYCTALCTKHHWQSPASHCCDCCCWLLLQAAAESALSLSFFFCSFLPPSPYALSAAHFSIWQNLYYQYICI